MTDKIEWHLNGTPGPWYADHESVMAANPWDDSDHDVMTSAVYPGGYTRNGDADEIRRQTNARAIAEVPAMVQALRDVERIMPIDDPERDALVNTILTILARIDGGNNGQG